MEAVPCKRQKRNSYLHESLLEEILIRLPVKSIFRFKSVSKHWFNLISNPCFVRSHLSHKKRIDKELSLSPPWTILFRYSYKHNNPLHLQFQRIASSDFTSPGLSIPSPHPDYPETDYKILSICSNSGLVLLRAWYTRQTSATTYHLCNPITSQCVTLPPPPKRKSIVCPWNIVTQVDDKGCITSYRVVVLNRPIVSSDVLHMDIFSSETKKWMSIKVHCPKPVSFNWGSTRSILCNGILHYFTKKYVNQPVILAYDPYIDSKDFRLIEYPRNSNITDGLCCVSQGRLLYFGRDLNEKTFKMWVLEDYDRGNWRLEYSVELSKEISKFYVYKPLSFHPFNSNVVYMWHDGCISSFDMRTRRLEVCGEIINLSCGERPNPEDCILYVFPPWPMSVPLLSTEAIVHS